MRLSVAIIVSFVKLFALAEKITEEQYASLPELFHMDNYDHCLMLGKKALFCTVTIQLAPIKTKHSEIWEVIKVIISSKKNFRHDILRHSICVPVTCPNTAKNISLYINNKDFLVEHISTCYSKKYNNIGLYGNVSEIYCQTEQPLYDIDIYDVTVGISLFVLATIVLLSSFYDGLARYQSKEEYHKRIKSKYGRIISCFSIPMNWERLKTLNTTEDTINLKVVNGVRFCSIILVVIAHSCMVAFTTYSTNPEFVETMTTDPMNIIFLNGYYCIQTFLLLSGTLLSYYFFKTLEKRQTFKLRYIVFAFFGRYIRLTTCLVVVVAFSATWLRHINRGPLWDKTVGQEYRNCRKNWWTNLLYINNYYDYTHMCLQQSWYLAADTQLFICSLMVLVVISKFKKFIFHILGGCLVVSILIPGVINYVNNYDFIIRQYPEPLYEMFVQNPEWYSMFIPAHTNFGSYVMGLVAGYIIYTYRDEKIVVQKRYIVLWWIVIWTLPLSVIFLGIPLYYDNFEYTRLGAAVYVALSRNVFTVGICLGMLGVTKNIGWLLRDAVTWPPLQILGRLTYCVYLVHPALMRIKAGHARVETYLTPFAFTVETSNNLLLSYIAALVLCLFVEMPTSALQKLVMPEEPNEDENKNNKDVMINSVFKNEITKM